MSDNVEDGTINAPFREGMGRIWSEIKQISKQVEVETRKSGRSARLKLPSPRFSVSPRCFVSDRLGA